MRMEQDGFFKAKSINESIQIYLRMFKGCNHVNVTEFKGHGGLLMGSRRLLGTLLLGLGAVGALLAVQVGVGLEGRLSGGTVGRLLLSGT